MKKQKHSQKMNMTEIVKTSSNLNEGGATDRSLIKSVREPNKTPKSKSKPGTKEFAEHVQVKKVQEVKDDDSDSGKLNEIDSDSQDDKITRKGDYSL